MLIRNKITIQKGPQWGVFQLVRNFLSPPLFEFLFDPTNFSNYSVYVDFKAQTKGQKICNEDFRETRVAVV